MTNIRERTSASLWRQSYLRTYEIVNARGVPLFGFIARANRKEIDISGERRVGTGLGNETMWDGTTNRPTDNKMNINKKRGEEHYAVCKFVFQLIRPRFLSTTTSTTTKRGHRHTRHR